MTLRVEYDPKFGDAIRDGEIEKIVASMIKHKDEVAWEYHRFATQNIFTRLRLAVKRDEISSNDIYFIFGATKIKIYPSGGASPWPEGFCDLEENYMLEML
jgi:hypothetical protein